MFNKDGTPDTGDGNKNSHQTPFTGPEEMKEELRANGALNTELDTKSVVLPNKPLLDDPAESPEVPLDAFPKSIQDFIKGVSAYAQVPHSIVMAYILGITSISLGKGLVFEDFRGRQTTANVYIIVVIESGKGKTTAMKLILRPLKLYEENMVEKWEKEILPKALVRKRFLEANRTKLLAKQSKPKSDNGVKKTSEEKAEGEAEEEAEVWALENIERELQEIEKRLVEPVLYKDDVTQAAAEFLLLHNNSTLSIAGGENRRAVAHMMDKDIEQNYQLQGFDREDIKPHRQTDQSRNKPIRNPLVHMVLSVQPDIAQELFSHARSNDNGTIGRFQVMHEAFQYPTKPGKPLPEGVQDKWNSIIYDLLITYRYGDGTQHCMVASQDLMQPLDEEFSRINQELNEGKHAAIRPQCSRRVEYMRKYCVILHALKHRNQAHTIPLEPKTIKDAVKLDRLFFSKMLGSTQDAQESKLEVDEKKVLDVISKHPGGISRSLISKRIRETAEVTKSITNRLLEKGSVTCEKVKPERGGTPSYVFRLADEEGYEA